MMGVGGLSVRRMSRPFNGSRNFCRTTCAGRTVTSRSCRAGAGTRSARSEARDRGTRPEFS